MANGLKPFPRSHAPHGNALTEVADESPVRTKRRPAWRQRLVEAERGISLGFRSDSTFFAHFFTGSIVVAAGCVLGLPLIEWTLVVLALTVVLSAEMFNQVLKAVWQAVGHHFTGDTARALRMGTAAVFVTILGATVTLGLILGRRLLEVLAE